MAVVTTSKFSFLIVPTLTIMRIVTALLLSIKVGKSQQIQLTLAFYQAEIIILYLITRFPQLLKKQWI